MSLLYQGHTPNLDILSSSWSGHNPPFGIVLPTASLFHTCSTYLFICLYCSQFFIFSFVPLFTVARQALLPFLPHPPLKSQVQMLSPQMTSWLRSLPGFPRECSLLPLAARPSSPLKISYTLYLFNSHL